MSDPKRESAERLYKHNQHLIGELQNAQNVNINLKARLKRADEPKLSDLQARANADQVAWLEKERQKLLAQISKMRGELKIAEDDRDMYNKQWSETHDQLIPALDKLEVTQARAEKFKNDRDQVLAELENARKATKQVSNDLGVSYNTNEKVAGELAKVKEELRQSQARECKDCGPGTGPSKCEDCCDYKAAWNRIEELEDALSDEFLQTKNLKAELAEREATIEALNATIETERELKMEAKDGVDALKIFLNARDKKIADLEVNCNGIKLERDQARDEIDWLRDIHKRDGEKDCKNCKDYEVLARKFELKEKAYDDLSLKYTERGESIHRLGGEKEVPDPKAMVKAIRTLEEERDDFEYKALTFEKMSAEALASAEGLEIALKALKADHEKEIEKFERSLTSLTWVANRYLNKKIKGE